MSTTEDLQQAVAHIQVVSQQFLAGDPAPFQACWSHADDVTLCGALGAYEQGWGTGRISPGMGSGSLSRRLYKL